MEINKAIADFGNALEIAEKYFKYAKSFHFKHFEPFLLYNFLPSNKSFFL